MTSGRPSRHPSTGELACALAVVGAVVVAVAAGGATAQTGGAYLSISDVTVSPEQPAPGELTRVTTTIENAQRSTAVVEVTDVYVRPAGSSRDLVRVEELGTITAGSSITVPLTLSFDDAGVRNLRLTVVGRTEGGTFVRVRYPLTVVVREGGPQLSVVVDEPVAGVETPVNVTVANGESVAFRQLELLLEGETLRVERNRRIEAQIGAGTDRQFEYAATFTEAGPQVVETTLRYRTLDGEVRTRREQVSVTVEDLREDVGIEASIPDRGQTDPPVAVDLTNFGNAPLTDAAVSIVEGDRTVTRRTVGQVDPDETQTLLINLTDVEASALDVVATYEIGTRTGEARTSLRYVSNPARIELTGIDTEWDSDRVTIAGSASNVGLEEANSVIVRVVAAEGVTPVAPNREYFVGTVPPSDFVSFDLTARVAENVSSLSVEVTYLADGRERREVVSVPIDRVDERANDDDASTGGLGLLVLGVVGAVVLAVAALVYARRRNRRAGE